MAGTPKPRTVSTKQAWIADLARQVRGEPIRTLAHHVDQDWLREAFRRTRKDAAAGVDDVSAADYAENLDENLESLLNRAKSGRYRAPPVRRVHIPKGNGETRPLGLPTVEDKVLQRAVKMLLEPLYEQEFYDFSYGFRPRRSPHDALEALHDGLWEMGGGWVLDADIQGCFDAIDHRACRDLLRKRVVDGVVVRLVGKWLNAGVLEDGVVTHPDTGSPQGGVISPLLSNIYLHEVVDRWWVEMVLPRLRGRAFMIRFADDFVMVFSQRSDAVRVHKVLGQRLDRFGLTLHPEKTRLVRFQRPQGDGGPKPETFDFLGFTLYWGKTRRGRWSLKRKTASKRLSRALREINRWMRQARHWPVGAQAAMLTSKLRGHYGYYGVQRNSRSIATFYYLVRRRWKYWLSRRSQRGWLTWEQYARLLERNALPPPRVRHGRRQLRLANL